MRLFDPWPVFFKREWKRNWPFLVGFAVTGTVITKLSLGLTEEDAKKSKFVQAHKRVHMLSIFCSEVLTKSLAWTIYAVSILPGDFGMEDLHCLCTSY
ncbi:unnamed protein product [Sphenostylis stenocarpa]|uniref:Uncharacterized protein n=1 Tax=Sphenostylis stenocarpa TaxID=92480 RepID=A0AA86VQ54_9FABA|nr:unnamed protein product [Sphenostylis stenocarpa]